MYSIGINTTYILIEKKNHSWHRTGIIQLSYPLFFKIFSSSEQGIQRALQWSIRKDLENDSESEQNFLIGTRVNVIGCQIILKRQFNLWEIPSKWH